MEQLGNTPYDVRITHIRVKFLNPPSDEAGPLGPRYRVRVQGTVDGKRFTASGHANNPGQVVYHLYELALEEGWDGIADVFVTIGKDYVPAQEQPC
jgi:hypothetical protein